MLSILTSSSTFYISYDSYHTIFWSYVYIGHSSNPHALRYKLQGPALAHSQCPGNNLQKKEQDHCFILSCLSCWFLPLYPLLNIPTAFLSCLLTHILYFLYSIPLPHTSSSYLPTPYLTFLRAPPSEI